MSDTMYRTIRLPKVLVDQVEERVDNSNMGYRSIAEFVSEAVRKQLDEHRQKQEVPSQ